MEPSEPRAKINSSSACLCRVSQHSTKSGNQRRPVPFCVYYVAQIVLVLHTGKPFNNTVSLLMFQPFHNFIKSYTVFIKSVFLLPPSHLDQHFPSYIHILVFFLLFLLSK